MKARQIPSIRSGDDRRTPGVGQASMAFLRGNTPMRDRPNVLRRPTLPRTYWITPRISDSFIIIRSSPSIFTSFPDHLPYRILSPVLTPIGCSLPSSPRAPGPAATTLPCIGFSLAVSGMMMPPFVFSSASSGLTRTRSCSGRNFIAYSLDWIGPASRPTASQPPAKADHFAPGNDDRARHYRRAAIVRRPNLRHAVEADKLALGEFLESHQRPRETRALAFDGHHFGDAIGRWLAVGRRLEMAFGEGTVDNVEMPQKPQRRLDCDLPGTSGEMLAAFDGDRHGIIVLAPEPAVFEQQPALMLAGGADDVRERLAQGGCQPA